ncbi:hypothetical protein WJX84_008303 [Apatococcus fuscideae]|uniref:Fatty acid desaturase domain-containing protein n=1 Tax=Apatococcus fuscideae TaxID=2026836 RepID=A0AAW1STN3_9CHLO
MALAFVPSPSVTVPRSEPYAARNRHRYASNYVVGYSHTKSTTRPPFAVPKAALKDFGRLDLLDKVYGSERTFAGELYVRALPGPLQYLPSFLVPGTLALSAAGAAFGPGILEAIANYLPAHQIPMGPLVRDTYVENTELCRMLIRTGFSCCGALFTMVIIPGVDVILGKEPEMETRSSDDMYRLVLYSVVAAHFSLILGSCALASITHLEPLPLLGLMVSMGCEGSMGFVIAHELLHSRQWQERTLAEAVLCTLGYMHWSKSHLVHHQRVATRDDCASAYLGETLYHFLYRSVKGNVQDAVSMELTRLRARHLPVWSLHNRVAWWVGMPLALVLGLYHSCGPQAVMLLVGQAAVGILLLETVNYIEHYGLQRKSLDSGGYETVTVNHSWNANWLFSNSVIFALQRHSDHHAHPSRHFQRLENIQEAPQLPASYPAMMMLAAAPPLFFRAMNHRALAWHTGTTDSSPPSTPSISGSL